MARVSPYVVGILYWYAVGSDRSEKRHKIAKMGVVLWGERFVGTCCAAQPQEAMRQPVTCITHLPVYYTFYAGDGTAYDITTQQSYV